MEPSLSRVLVVEDSRVQAEEIRSILEGHGFVVETAADGLEALAMIRGGPPDVVVTGYRMPRMDGLALVDAVRQDYPFVPIVLIAANGSEAIAAQALRDGAAGYVPKRFLHLDLIPTLRDILSAAEGTARRRRALGRLSRTEFEFVLDDATAIDPLIHHIEEILSATLIRDPSELIRVGVALREVLGIAIELGDQDPDRSATGGDRDAPAPIAELDRGEPPSRERLIHVTASITPSEAVFTIRDEGPPFPEGPERDHLGLAGLKAKVRNLPLIRNLMEDASPDEAGNEIRLVKRATVPTSGTR